MGTHDYLEAEEDIKKGLLAEQDNADLLALHKKLKVGGAQGQSTGC